MAVLRFRRSCVLTIPGRQCRRAFRKIVQKVGSLAIILSRNICIFKYRQVEYRTALATRETTMNDALDEEIETRFRLAGITLPAERKAQAMNAARTILKTLHWLRGPRTAAAEPSNIFSLASKES
jgi:hypothetical protein